MTKRALRTIGKGTLYIFTDDDPNTVQKIDMLKEGVPDENVIYAPIRKSGRPTQPVDRLGLDILGF